MIKRIFRTIRSLCSYPYLRECLRGINRGWFPVFVKYPVYPKPRYGYNGTEPHALLYKVIDRRRDVYRSELENCKQYKDRFLRIGENEPRDTKEPYWQNQWFSGLDAVSLYSFIAIKKPKIYLEIGSGNSTKFARKAIKDHNMDTKIISIDPHPRTEIDAISDQIVRHPLEETNLSLFDCLTEDDIVFFDGSHRCFMNSDVTVFFLEVLPKLPCGILIHIHDIHLPYDYPPERALHYESEQYLLATMLLGECVKYEIVLPNNFVANDESLSNTLDEFWKSTGTKIPKKGVSFWIRKK